MYVQYGNYRHGLQEASLKVVPAINYSEIGVAVEARLQFLIEGKLIANTRSELLSAITGLQNAYSFNGRDVRLLYEDETVALHYRSNTSLTGMMVTRPPTSIESMGSEWATHWTYAIVLEARYATDNLASGFVVGYNAGLRQSGTGGPAFVLVPSRNNAWRKQRTTAYTPVTRVQYGELTGLKDYPRSSVPRPLWPADLVPESYQYEEVAAAAGQQTQFTIRYSYEFLRNGPFS